MFNSKKKIRYKDVVNVKPGEIKFVPVNNLQDQLSPHVNNHKNLPDWFKDLGKHHGSIRSCAGTMDFLTSGVTMRFWTNAYFSPTMSESSKWTVEMDSVGHHPFSYAMEFFKYDQVGKCPISQGRMIEKAAFPKMVNPWNVITAPGWSTMVLPVQYEDNPNYETIPAIVNTDYYHTLNWVLKIKTDQPFQIDVGTPIMHLVPFKRDSDFSKVIIGDESERQHLMHRGLGKFQVMARGSSGKAYRIIETQMNKFLKNPKNIDREDLGF